MILARYTEFRRFFSSASPAADGLPAWPLASLRINGFSSTIIATTAGGHPFAGSPVGPLIGAVPALDAGFPFSITCNAGASDGSPPTHDYDWFVWTPVDPGRPPLADGTPAAAGPSPCVYATYPDSTKSGTIALNLNSSEAAKLLPGVSGYGLVTADSLAVLLAQTAVYVVRRSDSSISWGSLIGS